MSPSPHHGCRGMPQPGEFEGAGPLVHSLPVFFRRGSAPPEKNWCVPLLLYIFLASANGQIETPCKGCRAFGVQDAAAVAVSVFATGGATGAGSAFVSVVEDAVASPVLAGVSAGVTVAPEADAGGAPVLRLPYSVTYQPPPLSTKVVLEITRWAVFLHPGQGTSTMSSAWRCHSSKSISHASQ